MLTDIGQIAVGLPSKPNYLGANYLMNYLEDNSVQDFYKDINTHFQKIYKLIGKRNELNTLGYMYLRAGKTKTIKMYKKVISLDPEYKGDKEKLEFLKKEEK